MNAPRVTIEQIKEKIISEQYVVLPNGRTTVCQITLENGFTVEGYSACVSPENFNLKMGREIARDNAIEKIWPLEGYLLAEKMYRGELTIPAAAGFQDGEQ